jgi:alkyl hydroperoxide reductase subunit AhpC
LFTGLRRMGTMVKRPSPDFTQRALLPDGSFGQIGLRHMLGKYWLLFFYPLDFTFVCPTEILKYKKMHNSFKSHGCEVLGASVDSEYAHLAWTKMPREEGGLGGPLPFPLLSDKAGILARALGVLAEQENVALRATLLFDKQGICRHAGVNDLGIGRGVEEQLRLLQALIYTDTHQNEVCPASWCEGDAAISTNDPKEYFKTK